MRPSEAAYLRIRKGVSMVQSSLTGKVALVTGASRGIGRAVAERLARAGASIGVNFSQGREAAAEVVADIENRGGRAVALQADVGRPAEIRRLFEQTLGAFGQVDIVVATAGVMIHKPFTDTTEEDFDRIFDINAKGAFFVMQEAARHLADGGRIIAFSTTLTAMMVPGYAAYSGTKAAVEQFVRSLSREVGARKITVNAVAPGPVETDLLLHTETPQSLQFLAGLSAFGRLGQPADIAEVVAFLASDEARWVSGQVVRANGALT